jgi:hypothetical protein
MKCEPITAKEAQEQSANRDINFIFRCVRNAIDAGLFSIGVFDGYMGEKEKLILLKLGYKITAECELVIKESEDLIMTNYTISWGKEDKKDD